MKFEVYCIIIGGTESLLSVELPFGYKFIKVKEHSIYNEIKTQAGDLLQQYANSTLNEDIKNPEFIILTKSENKEFYFLEDITEYKKTCREQIEKLITLLQVFKPSSISIYQIFYKEDDNFTPLVAYADCTGIVLDKYTVSADEIANLQDFVCLDERIYKKLNILFSNYSNSTKFIDNFMQLQYLVTIGEMQVLNRSDKKRETFSKRIAILIGTNDAHIKAIYDILKKMYRLRSDWVHKGKCDGINNAEIGMLRTIMITLIKKYIDYIKIELISNPAVEFIDIKNILIKEANLSIKAKGNGFF